MGGTEQRYISEAFDTNWVAPLGPNVDALESTLASYCRVRHAAALSSGTSAIHLSLILLGVKTGDEVLAPTFTFSATVNPIIYQGADPVLIDSEPGTWNMDPVLLEKAIIERLQVPDTSAASDYKWKKKPKAIIVVHLYGMPANLGTITEIASKYDIPLIEDAAEALGSRYKGIPVGSFGKFGILSFNGNKIITTSGGGALLSDDESLIKRARFLSTQARDSAPHYQHSQIGYNYRMSNVLAGIGRGQMEVIDERVKRRREVYYFYRDKLGKHNGIGFLIEPSDDYFSNHWLTVLTIDPSKTGTTREAIQKKLELSNIESRPLWKPMHLQPVFSSYNSYISGVSENLFNNGLCLPSGTALTTQELEGIIKLVADSFES
jgi:dTDP-4-amino-4,6-dideoxygalactose transaminase